MHFSSAFVVHETIPKVGRYLKGYWLKEFPQHHLISLSLSLPLKGKLCELSKSDMIRSTNFILKTLPK